MQVIRNSLAILDQREKQRFGWLVLCDIIVSIADIAFLAMLLFVVHLYTQPNWAGKYNFLPQWLSDRNSLLLITLFFLLFSLKNLAGFLVFRAQCRFVSRVASRISHQQLLKYLKGDYANYVGVDSAAHIRKISYEPVEFCYHILVGIQQIITQLVLIIFTIAAMVIFNAKLFLLLLIILLPPVIIVFYLIKRKLLSVRKYTRINSEKSLQHLQEALNGFVESNVYHKNEFFLERYDTYQRQLNVYLSDIMSVQGMPSRMIEIFALMGLFILIVINKWSGSTDNAAILTIGAFMAAAYKIIPGIVKILNINGQINTYQYTIHDLLQKEIIPDKRGEPVKENIQSIRLENVSFKYNGQMVLNNLNLVIESGDFLGISGLSGKGKTTILNLLLGFLTPDVGKIAINDVCTSAPIRQQYWSNISYVKQQPFLIHDSILHNIILNEDHYDKKKLQKVIQVSGLDTLINVYPEGLDKMITENGKNISGGQRQRIALARALYKNSNLIILDEPFNELDEPSECGLLHHFKHLAQAGKLIILITHNKKSLSFCNKTVSLDEDQS
jgi:ABC-type bacteriocin/lantibiotic exporter with double-glycine peptidase domain